MKKLRVLIAFLLSAALLFVAAACGGGGELEKPLGFSLDETDLLTWNDVEGARSYRIGILSVATNETKEDTSRTSEYSLSSLAEGDYEIRVMAVGSGQANARTSEWSDTVAFHKEHETGLLYRLVNNIEYEILRVGTALGDIVIDEMYRGKPVVSIAERAFRAAPGVESVQIGDSVRSIGNFAFYNCRGLTSVTLPESLTYLGESAFQGCSSLASVALPEHLETVSRLAFAYCRGLTSLDLGAVTTILDSAFYECSALAALTVPDTVTFIGENAFASSGELEEIEFGSGIETISASAFTENEKLSSITFKPLDGELVIAAEAFRACTSLAELTLPEGLTELGNYAFAASTQLLSVSLPASLKEIGVGVFNETALYASQTAEGGDGMVYADNWLIGVSPELRDSITSVDADSLHEGTSGIAASVFYQAKNLSSVILPVSVKHIGNRAFYGCPLLYMFMSDAGGLETIGDYALARCPIFNNLVLSEGLREIGSYAFAGSSQVRVGEGVPSTVRRIGMQAFADTGVDADGSGVMYAGNWVVGYDASSIGSDITLNSGTVGIADYAFNGAESVVNVMSMASVQYIGEGAFALCTSLGSAAIGSAVTEIKPYTFYKCALLYLVDLGSATNLETIGDYAFYACSYLDGIDLGSTHVKSIGSHAFYECGNLKTAQLGQELTQLSPYAFYHCVSLTSVTVPDPVVALGERAFGRCDTLSSVTLGENLKEIGMLAFRECVALKSVVLPDAVETVDDYAFYGCSALESATFGEGLRSIGKYAFFGCALESVVLPAGLKTIGASAFKNCSSLRTVVFCGIPETVGAYAFFANGAALGLGGFTAYVAGGTGAGWNEAWNAAQRPVVTGCTFRDGYLVSVSVGEEGIGNAYAWGGLTAPVREGYVFAGWASSPEATVAEFALNDILRAAGTTFYAVWQAV